MHPSYLPTATQCLEAQNQNLSNIITDATDSKAVLEHLETKRKWIDSHPSAQVLQITDSDETLPPSEVPLQRIHTGSGVIPSSLASTPCASLGVPKLLEHLNHILGTDHPSPTSRKSILVALLNMCINRGFDLGTAYAYLRPRWHDLNGLVEVEDNNEDSSDEEDGYEDTEGFNEDDDVEPEGEVDGGDGEYEDDDQEDEEHTEGYKGTEEKTLETNHSLQRLRKFLHSDSQSYDDTLRKNAINEQNQIIGPKIPPRRLWDLYSNRVVPYWVANATGYADPQCTNEKDREMREAYFRLGFAWFSMVAVSHAWLSDDLRRPIDTPINGHEWPVPVPNDTTLERVRIELLNYGVEYAWLDVLCLRQEGPKEKEMLRVEEWKLDVPTIGRVYDPMVSRLTLCYFNGLGRPFEVGNMESERHWLNRAWTLQETRGNLIKIGWTEGIGRLTASRNKVSIHEIHRARRERRERRALTPKERDTGSGETRQPGAPVWVIEQRIESIKGAIWDDSKEQKSDIRALLEVMSARFATNERDKICGLAYLLEPKILPAFMLSENTQAAWSRLVEVINGSYRAALFFGYPAAGDGGPLWYPSWQQVAPANSLHWVETDTYEVLYDGGGDIFHIPAFCFEGTLASCQCKKEGCAELLVSNGRHRYKFHRRHNIPVPNGHYTFVGSKSGSRWVAGQITARGFTKLCTLERSGNDPISVSIKKVDIL